MAETAMYRVKRLFEPGLKNRLLHSQRTEAGLRCKILYEITQRGMPQFEWSLGDKAMCHRYESHLYSPLIRKWQRGRPYYATPL